MCVLLIQTEQQERVGLCLNSSKLTLHIYVPYFSHADIADMSFLEHWAMMHDNLSLFL
jgi:hypothetical protein